MKFLHTADLHIGKRIFEASLIEEQKQMLDRIASVAKEERAEAVLIAGDVYDRTVPSAEAVRLLDDFLTRLLAWNIPVLLISGNHDSPERLAFAERILEKQGLYIAGTYDGEIKRVTLHDAYGPVTFVCLPFVKPAAAGCSTAAEAVEKMLGGMNGAENEEGHRTVLLTHYFVPGNFTELSGSESDINVGGLDAVPVSLFSDFSYVALGHIHKSQQIGGGNVYYSGSPLKYSFSEVNGEKSVNIVELGEQGEVSVRKRVIKPLHEMRSVRGTLQQLISGETLKTLEAEGISREDFLQVTLTDTEELLDPMGTLRGVYPNVLHIVFDKNKERETAEYESHILNIQKNTAELFGEFYEMLQGVPLDEKRKSLVEEASAESLFPVLV